VELGRRWLPWAACALSGALGFLGYVGFDQFYLNWICLVPGLWAIHQASPRRALLLAWVGGAIAHAGGFYWMHHLLQEFGNLPGVVAWLGVVGVGAYHGFSYGVWAWIVRFLGSRTRWSILWFGPVAWVVVERFYPFLFPMYFGVGQHPLTPVLQIADVSGPLGISFLVVWLNILVWECVRRRAVPLRPTATFAAVLLLVLIYGFVRIAQVDEDVAAAPKLRVGLVQTNLGARDKVENPTEFFRRHRVMTRALEREHDDLDLVVWPESVINLYVTKDAPRLGSRVFGSGRAPLLAGVVARRKHEGKVVPYATALLLGRGEKVLGRYEKRRLVPFGEYIPMADVLPFLDGWSPHQGNYASGEDLDPIPFGDYRLSVNICYEDIFATDVRELMIGDGDRETLPHAIVNLTNDSWYGDTAEPFQHLVLATIRCIEHRRAMVRATNTGISAFIDPAGRIVSRTGQWEPATLVGELPMLTGRTLYSHLGDWPAWIGLVVLGAGLFKRR